MSNALDNSYNDNEPAVCRPRERLDCPLLTKADVLVLDHTMNRRFISRKSGMMS